jgi:hypothetical protein
MATVRVFLRQAQDNLVNVENVSICWQTDCGGLEIITEDENILGLAPGTWIHYEFGENTLDIADADGQDALAADPGSQQ